MLGFQTISCLHEIPVVRSSTTKLQDVYSKAKDTSEFIRLPCSVAEIVVDRALNVVYKIASPLVEPLSKPVSAIDNYAAETIRQIEQKYPVINTSTENVVKTFNAKTKPVINVMNTVKDTTTSTIQHGKETVSNVATATVQKASGVADSVFSYYETYVPKIPLRSIPNTNELTNRFRQLICSLFNYALKPVEPTLVWFRILVFQCLVKTKQTNDVLLNKIQRKPLLTFLPQRLLILFSTLLENIIQNIKPNGNKSTKSKKTQEKPRLNIQSEFFNQKYLKSNLFATIRKYVPINEQERSATSTQDLNNCSTAQQDFSNDLLRPQNQAGNDNCTVESTSTVPRSDIEGLHVQSKPTDNEFHISSLPVDVLSSIDNQEPLTQEQQALHARIMNTDLERQDSTAEENDNES